MNPRPDRMALAGLIAFSVVLAFVARSWFPVSAVG